MCGINNFYNYFSFLFVSAIALKVKWPALSVKNIHRLLKPTLPTDDYSEDRLTCQYCKRCFQKIPAKIVHEKTCFSNPTVVREKEPLFCNDCGFTCSNKYSLTYHKAHDCGVVHRCEKCNNTFLTLQSLKRHCKNNCKESRRPN